MADKPVKILLIGDSGVGKTSLLHRYTDDTYSGRSLQTIGIDFKLKSMELDDGRELRLQIWDTAGQERFRTITQAYYRGAQGVLLCYSIIDDQSFAQIRTWMASINDFASNRVQKILIATKCDVEDSRMITRQQGESLAEEFGMQFFETSAKNNVNVAEPFAAIAQLVMKDKASHIAAPPTAAIALKVNAPPSSERSRCSC